MIYIVICAVKAHEEYDYYIDSAWTSGKKAIKKCEKLNSKKYEKWREERKFFDFVVEPKNISK